MTLYVDAVGRPDERLVEHEVVRTARDTAAAMSRLTEHVASVNDPQIYTSALHELADVARAMFKLDREITMLGDRMRAV
ncbi:hypothetical protein [Burkholderia mayonis]|uniref:Uncharacterized protein n=1 Tax=Burkholderia mayonis TaxID=1385591 RepID=A0A1B4G159_9BURK|nr:hypothetical protein [Burkholderia mayonis]AOJ09644.1 hypothetical protein WS71_20240 [Burkholderia mayonis]KVE52265.1 hypothetical protein WS71_10065 [Burkholderia mayonis]